MTSFDLCNKPRGPLTLAEWRAVRRLSQAQAAALISAALGRPVRQQNVRHWEAGVMPGADVAEAVRKATGGAVTGDSFGRRHVDLPGGG